MRAVVEDLQPDTFRQRGLELFQPRRDRCDKRTSVGTAKGQHQPLHGFALTVMGHGAIAGETADPDFGNVS